MTSFRWLAVQECHVRSGLAVVQPEMLCKREEFPGFHLIDSDTLVWLQGHSSVCSQNAVTAEHSIQVRAFDITASKSPRASNEASGSYV